MSSFCWYNLRNLLNLSLTDIHEVGLSLRIPIFTQKQINDLCDETIAVLQHEPFVLNIKSPINLIGDLHGNFIDLLRIFSTRRPPPQSKYLFLGDYVDRGQFSTETIVLLFTLKCIFPDSIYLIRGNHEFSCINSLYGFQKEVEAIYGSDLVFRKINTVFTWLPLTAIINSSYFCVHGGLSPLLTDISQLDKIERPIVDYFGDTETDRIIADLVWSDPSTSTRGFSTNPRGIGQEFGYHPVANFLMHNNLKHLFRAHQTVIKGIADHCNGVVTTVFSTSFIMPNKEMHYCGIIHIDGRSQIQSFGLEPVKEPINRLTACFKPADIPGFASKSESTSYIPRQELKINDSVDHSSYQNLYSKKRKSLFSRCSQSDKSTVISSLMLFNKKLSQSRMKIDAASDPNFCLD